MPSPKGPAAGLPKIRTEKIPRRRENGHRLRFHRCAFRRLRFAPSPASVWAGFDKPQKIYRGAFGSVHCSPRLGRRHECLDRQISAARFPVPPSVHKVEICSKSGLLATDKCYDRRQSANGDIVGGGRVISSGRRRADADGSPAMCTPIRSAPSWSRNSTKANGRAPRSRSTPRRSPRSHARPDPAGEGRSLQRGRLDL